MHRNDLNIVHNYEIVLFYYIVHKYAWSYCTGYLWVIEGEGSSWGEGRRKKATKEKREDSHREPPWATASRRRHRRRRFSTVSHQNPFFVQLSILTSKIVFKSGFKCFYGFVLRFKNRVWLAKEAGFYRVVFRSDFVPYCTVMSRYLPVSRKDNYW